MGLMGMRGAAMRLAAAATAIPRRNARIGGSGADAGPMKASHQRRALIMKNQIRMRHEQENQEQTGEKRSENNQKGRGKRRRKTERQNERTNERKREHVDPFLTISLFLFLPLLFLFLFSPTSPFSPSRSYSSVFFCTFHRISSRGSCK